MDTEQAFEYYEKALRFGNQEALPNLARICWTGGYKGQGPQKDRQRALTLFKEWISCQSEEIQSHCEGLSDEDWQDHLDRVFCS